MLVLSQD